MSKSDSEDEIHDFAIEAPRPVIPVVSRAEPAPLAYRSKKTNPATGDPETIKNVQMPIWLLAGGVAIETVAAFLRGGGMGAIAGVGLEVLAGTVMMLVGILLAARLRGINLGGFWPAALKLAAISIAPSALFDLAYPVLGVIPVLGVLLGLAAEFILYFALLGALFDLDGSDTWYCVWIIFLVRLGVYFAFVAVSAKLG